MYHAQNIHLPSSVEVVDVRVYVSCRIAYYNFLRKTATNWTINYRGILLHFIFGHCWSSKTLAWPGPPIARTHRLPWWVDEETVQSQQQQRAAFTVDESQQISLPVPQNLWALSPFGQIPPPPGPKKQNLRFFFLWNFTLLLRKAICSKTMLQIRNWWSCPPKKKQTAQLFCCHEGGVGKGKRRSIGLLSFRSPWNSVPENDGWLCERGPPFCL